MSYRLTADIDDVGRTEASALVRAILEKHGSLLVVQELKLLSKQPRVDRGDVVTRFLDGTAQPGAPTAGDPHAGKPTTT